MRKSVHHIAASNGFFTEVPFDYTAIARLQKHINILMLVLVFEHVAIPIFWKALDNGKDSSKAQRVIIIVVRQFWQHIAYAGRLKLDLAVSNQGVWIWSKCI